VRENQRAALRDVFVSGYDALLKRLTRRLGSVDVASDALQETFLRVERILNAGAIDRPDDYLFRIAMNVAIDRRRSEQRFLRVDEVHALLNVADDSPTAATIVEGRQDIEILDCALQELSPRVRHIFSAAMVKHQSDSEIAAELGISSRTVEIDLSKALKHCAQRLGRTLSRRGGGPRPR
jgi:RNA polymerase sigma-70 factor, ECF subfamily